MVLFATLSANWQSGGAKVIMAFNKAWAVGIVDWAKMWTDLTFRE